MSYNNSHNLPMYSEPRHEYEQYPDDDYQYPTEAEIDQQNIDIYENLNNVDYYGHMNRMYALVFEQLVQEGVIVPNSQIDQIEPSQPNIIHLMQPALNDQQDLDHHRLYDQPDDQQNDQLGHDIDLHIDEAMMDYFNRHQPR